MKRLRTWAWPDRQLVAQRIQKSTWGQGFWRSVVTRRHRDRSARFPPLSGVTLVPLVRFSLGDAPEAPPAAPVVH